MVKSLIEYEPYTTVSGLNIKTSPKFISEQIPVWKCYIKKKTDAEHQSAIAETAHAVSTPQS